MSLRPLRTICYLLYLGGLITLSLLALELVYRKQIINFYKPELTTFNLPTDLEKKEKSSTILCMGDSFTAGLYSYPAYLREIKPNYRVINGGIPGTGIKQALYAADYNFSQFDPELFIYQVYVGNDLLDIRYPVNPEKLTLSRSTYWTLANQLRSISFLNYRLGQILSKQNSSISFDPTVIQQGVTKLDSSITEQGESLHEQFSPALYSLRDQIYLQAEPELIDNHVMLNPARAKEFEIFKEDLLELLSYCQQPKCRAIVVLIPHASQVNSRYRSDLETLGAKFSSEFGKDSEEYPFFLKTKEFLQSTTLENITLLNVLPEFQKHENLGVPLYYANDPHLNQTGQALLANIVAEQF